VHQVCNLETKGGSLFFNKSWKSKNWSKPSQAEGAFGLMEKYVLLICRRSKVVPVSVKILSQDKSSVNLRIWPFLR